MSATFEVHQLLLIRTPSGSEVVAASPGIDFGVEEFARRIAVSIIGDTPGSGQSVFALPVDARRVAIGTVVATATRPTVLRLLVLDHSMYAALGDPFAISDGYAVNTDARGSLPTLEHPQEEFPPRRVDETQRILQCNDSAFLLGAAQALLDGASIRLARRQPQPELLRHLWQLLPHSNRGELWPCEYCHSDTLPFRIAVLPELPDRLPAGVISEDQCRDYPEGRYELALQAAAENSDQPSLDLLFARASPRSVLRMALAMLAFAVAAAVIMKAF